MRHQSRLDHAAECRYEEFNRRRVFEAGGFKGLRQARRSEKQFMSRVASYEVDDDWRPSASSCSSSESDGRTSDSSSSSECEGGCDCECECVCGYETSGNDDCPSYDSSLT